MSSSSLPITDTSPSLHSSSQRQLSTLAQQIAEVQEEIKEVKQEIKGTNIRLESCNPEDKPWFRKQVEQLRDKENKLLDKETELSREKNLLLQQQQQQASVTAAAATSQVPYFTSEQLLLQARPRVLPAQASDWVIRLTRLYPNEMNLATRDQSVAHMRAICDRFEQQPRSTTIRIFHEQGISLGDPLHTTGNAVLYYGTKGSTPVILKKLDDPFELKGYHAVDALDTTQRRSNHLAPFKLFKAVSPLSTPAPPSPGARQPASSSSPSSSSAALILSSASFGDIPPPGASLPRTPTKSTKSGVSVSSSGVDGAQLGASFPSSTHSRVSRDWVSMHHYPITLDGFTRPMTAAAASKLLTQMLSALHFLHMSGLAHMDVKPSNILVDSTGEFWLGDFGSVRRIGTASINTTPSFLPGEMRQSLIEPYLVRQQHDDWMLGMTVADMLAARPEDGVGTGASDPSSDHVLRVLADLNTPDATQLINRLHLN